VTFLETPTLSVVIPAYNRCESVLRLLDDVYAQVGVAFEVIVVDDHSPDSTATVVAERFPQAVVLQHDRNRGPAVSRNTGVRQARGTIVVGFDSDVTVPDRYLLARVVDVFGQCPWASGLAFRIFSSDGRSEDRPRWWHPLSIHRYADRSFDTHYFSGTGYAFRRADLIAAGLFPEVLYMHYEEVELAFRVLDNGGTIVYRPDLAVCHHAHPVSRRGEVQKFYKPRNQILVALACYPWPRAIVYLAPRLVYNLCQAVGHREIGAFGRALFSAWTLAPQVLSSRRPLKDKTWRRISAMRQQPAGARRVEPQPASKTGAEAG